MEQAQIDLLVLDAQQGDSEAFSILCQHYHQSLIRFSFKVCSNEQLAHDAVQNSWIKVAKSIKRIQDPRAFKSWLYQSVRWQTIDLLRRSQKEVTAHSDVDINELGTTPSIDVEESDVMRAINLLPDIDKQAVYLFYLEQMTLQEISIVLAIPVGTIKSRLNRARKSLRQNLSDMQE